MTSARSFLFDGTSLKSLGFSLCSFDGGGEDRLPLFYVPAYTTERPAGHHRWHVTGSHYEEPLSFTLSFARLCQEDPTVSVSQERALARWLTASPDYREFSFEDFDSGTDPLAGITYFVHVTSLEKEMLGGRCLGFTAGFAADSPFGYTAPVTKALSPGTASISVTSDLPQPLYPALSITASAAEYDVDTEMVINDAPWYVSPESDLIKKLCEVYENMTGNKAELMSMGGGTYARSLKNRGVAFGPGFPETPDGSGGAHQANEYLSIDMLMRHAPICLQAMYELMD